MLINTAEKHVPPFKQYYVIDKKFKSQYKDFFDNIHDLPVHYNILSAWIFIQEIVKFIHKIALSFRRRDKSHFV
jgi:hypothetical protein